MPAAGFFEAVERGNVWVVELGEEFSFSLESREAVTIFGELFDEDFDGDVTAELRVSGSIDFSIPPAPTEARISNSCSRVPGSRDIFQKPSIIQALPENVTTP